MADPQTILIIVLSVAFLTLLVLAIVFIVILIRVLRNIQHVTQKIEETSDNVGEVAKYAGRKLGPAALTALAGLMWKAAKSSIKRKGKL